MYQNISGEKKVKGGNMVVSHLKPFSVLKKGWLNNAS